MKRAVFFCSASNTIEPRYNEVARSIVEATCKAGYDIVSGGTIKGTMNVVAQTAADCGVENIGVVPRFMKGIEHPGLTQTIWTDTMSERKEAMRKGISLAVALPGGIGTLDELAETYTLVKMNLLDAKVIVLNLGGFYDDLVRLLDHYVETNMLDSVSRSKIYFVTSLEEYMKVING